MGSNTTVELISVYKLVWVPCTFNSMRVRLCAMHLAMQVLFHEDLGPWVGWWENFLCVSSPQETLQLTDPRMSWDRVLSAVKWPWDIPSIHQTERLDPGYLGSNRGKVWAPPLWPWPPNVNKNKAIFMLILYMSPWTHARDNCSWYETQVRDLFYKWTDFWSFVSVLVIIMILIFIL